MKYEAADEKLAKEEYLKMIDTLQSSDEFEHEWKGQWNDFEKQVFGGKVMKVKGDRDKYMKYWLENQSIINDLNWDKIEKEEDEYI